MNGFDIAVIIVMLLSLLIGAWRGLAKEVLSLLGWPVALLCSYFLAEDIAPLIPDVGPPVVIQVLAYAAVFIAVLIIWSILVWLLSRFLHAIGLAWLDRSLGCLFGVIRGVLIILIVAWLAGLTEIPKQPFWQQAMLSDTVERYALLTRQWLPVSIASRINF